jgi:hypothetical protein
MGSVLLFWLTGARAREFATGLAQRYCQQRGMQFLDGTVSLARVGIRWTNAGLRVRRMFRFDFSLEGVGRRTGYILMLGTDLEAVDDGLPKARIDEKETGPEPARKEDGKVVPFRRKDR